MTIPRDARGIIRMQVGLTEPAGRQDDGPGVKNQKAPVVGNPCCPHDPIAR